MDEIRRRMPEEISRHIAYAQAALRLGRIGKCRLAPQRIGDAPAPFEMLGGRVLGAGAIGKIEREQQARARVGVIGRLGQAQAERFHPRGCFAAGHQGQGEVVMQRGVAAVER